MPEETTLFLLPGMGADARMFRPQQRAFPGLQVAAWLPPERRETVAHYAERLAERTIQPANTLIGGASFGGIVALELAALSPARKCLLIGSLRAPSGLPGRYRSCRPFSGLTSFAPAVAAASLWMVAGLCSPPVRGVLRQLAEADGKFLSWAVRALLDWNPSPQVAQVSISQIHGQRDWLLPANLSRADLIIPKAGHLLSLTHPEPVNEFIRNQMSNFSAPLPPNDYFKS